MACPTSTLPFVAGFGGVAGADGLDGGTRGERARWWSDHHTGHAGHDEGRHILGVLEEGQNARYWVKIDAQQVAGTYLAGGDQVGEGMNQLAVQGPLQVTGSVFHVGAFQQQEIFGLFGEGEDEGGGAGRVEDALLHEIQLDCKNFPQFWCAEWVKYHSLVDAVHEFGRELASRRFQADAHDLD